MNYQTTLEEYWKKKIDSEGNIPAFEGELYEEDLR